MKTGTIIMISTKSWMGKIIQWFQKLADKESGKWNHTGVYLEDDIDYIVEAAQTRGSKVKAAVVATPLSEYMDYPKKYEVLFLEPNFPYSTKEARAVMFEWFGVPYDFKNLIVHQAHLKLFGWWIGRKRKKAHKKVVCHEFTMAFWNDVAGIFPDWHKAQVSKIYHSKHFKKVEI